MKIIMKKRVNKKKNYRNILLVLAVIIFILLLARSAAKYVLERKDTHAQDSSSFYFESEIADIDDGKTYTLYWDGEETKKISFSLKNYIDQLQMTNQDIKYKITAAAINNADDVNLKIYDESENVISSNEVLTLKGAEVKENNYGLDITSNTTLEEETEIDIKLTFSSTEPYTKELNSTLKVIVKKDKEYELKYIENEDHTVINLRTHTLRNDIEIEYDNTKYVVDISNNIVKNSQIKTNGEKNTIKIPKNILEDNSNYEIILINKV